MLMIVLVVLLAIVAYIVVIYNALVKNRQQVKEAWSTIDTQLKRRYDLIPNLVETVKGYAAHESGTLEKVIQARAEAMNQTGAKAKGKAEEGLTGALKSIFALGENYPDLKANQNFLSLQQELSDTETKIQASRQFYNTVVMTMNTKVEMFPSNIIAKLFHFAKEDFFEMSAEEAKAAQQAPQVKF